MRLTEKVNLDKRKPSFYEPEHQEQYSTKEKRQAINKLGRLEDIEDELGIELIILFKALKNGAYFRNPYYKNEIMKFDDLENNISFVARCFDIRMEHFVRLYDYSSGGALFPFKKYGKTWALTKEELK